MPARTWLEQMCADRGAAFLAARNTVKHTGDVRMTLSGPIPMTRVFSAFPVLRACSRPGRAKFRPRHRRREGRRVREGGRHVAQAPTSPGRNPTTVRSRALCGSMAGAGSEGTGSPSTAAMEVAARKGYVSATISYRLTDANPKKPATRNPYPAQIHDCKAAIRWLRANADNYHIDPERFGVSGGSCGGAPEPSRRAHGRRRRPRGGHPRDGPPSPPPGSRQWSTSSAPPGNAEPAQGRPHRPVHGGGLCGGTPDAVPEQYRLSSPLTFVTKDDPPILTFHEDGEDDIVPVQQAKLLDEKCRGVGRRTSLRIFEGQKRGFRRRGTPRPRPKRPSGSSTTTSPRRPPDLSAIADPSV